MKLALFLCALILSLQGWCAAVAPSRATTRAITPGSAAVEKVKQKEGTNGPLLLDKKKTALIGWGLVAYLTVICWWAITTKNSLDRILKNVLQDIARYPS